MEGLNGIADLPNRHLRVLVQILGKSFGSYADGTELLAIALIEAWRREMLILKPEDDSAKGKSWKP